MLLARAEKQSKANSEASAELCAKLCFEARAACESAT